MARTRLSLKRSLLLSTFLALSSFSAVSLAATTETTAEDAKTTTTDNAAPAATTTDKAQSTTTSLPKLSSSTSTSADPTDLPALSTATTAKMPTLSKTVDNSVPTYPPPSPPPIANAPFMRQSTLPDGTVFICVGAILGLFGAAILIWRGVVAFLLKRSVEKAAKAQYVPDSKTSSNFPAPPAPFYHRYSTLDSTPNLSNPTTSGRGQRRTTRGPTVPSATPSMTNLFFSPTAAAGAGGNTSANRESRFLPSGFYAATSAAPANQGHGHSISLTDLAPGNRASQAVRTPPESPNLMPRMTPPAAGVGGHNHSQSSLSLSTPAAGGRAPSAFLEDILDDSPEAFPPQGMMPQQQQQGGSHLRHMSGSQNRF
ncbi:hypothetical protein DL546_001783 [Coniochaeta pulveracea]|uniref:Uncharacterized protein n=1 Tax=Coniochaeta pulveracea TaxID=177199 RepID=A0A420Y1X1_9PEZI|nr:hypothetical protein DL546_001783 [Coniochaeta pulveracea]